MKLSVILIFFLSSLVADVVNAQTITGQIKDEQNKPLFGVNIKVKDSPVAVLSDKNGNFSIKVTSLQATLAFSFIGFVPQEVALAGRDKLAIVLKTASTVLEEVRVIGYGTQRSSLVSSSISSITSKQIEDQPVRNVAEAMVGQVAGVQVQTASGSPGTAPIIRIRGIGSLGAGNDPLFVVDGYPLSSSENFDQISPEDIEKVEILKDAAAAAIYGSRGGNGVVIVITKRGKSTRTQFNYSSFVGLDQAATRVSVLDKDQYIDYIKTALFYPGRTGVIAPSNLNDPSSMANTDWQDEIFKNGLNQNQQISAAGGNALVQFFMAGSYNQQKGIVMGTGYDRYNFRANVDAQLSPKLKLSFNIAPSYTSRDDRPVSSDQFVNNYFAGMPLSSGTIGINTIAMVQNALYLPPIIPVKLANGDYDNLTTDPFTKGTSISAGYYNPVAVGELFTDKTTTMRMLGNVTLNYEILKKLNFKVNVGGETSNNRRNMFIPSTLTYNSSTLATFSNPVLAGIMSQQRSNQNYNWLWENTLTYDFNLSTSHHFTLLAGYSAQKNTSESSGIASVAGSYASDAIEYISTSSNITGTATRSLNSLISQFARVNYDFKEKYLLTAALRRDGSSRFGSNNRYALFPSASLGWRISKESFLTGNKIFSELKVRLSYGETGNNNIGDFAAIASLGPANYTFGTGTGSPYYGFAPTAFTNADLTWEKNRQLDIGLEAGFLNNRFYITADMYERNSDGLLTSTPISSLAGFSGSYLRNVGTIRNRGIDVLVNTRNLNGKFKWSTDFNVSINRNKITDYYKESGDFYAAVFGWNTVFKIGKGGSIGDIYGLETDGVFKNQAEVDAGPKWQTGSFPGDIRFKDQDGDNVITDKDRIVFANTQPKFTYGITNSFSFKGVDLRILIQGVQGSKVVYATDRFIMGGGGFYNASTEILDRWQSADNPGNGIVPRYNASGNSADFSSRYVRDGSYIRLRNLAISYLLPANVVKSIHLKSAKISVTGQNLFTITNYPGYNPETNIEGRSAFRTNVDQGSYPFARTYALGLNIGF